MSVPVKVEFFPHKNIKLTSRLYGIIPCMDTMIYVETCNVTLKIILPEIDERVEWNSMYISNLLSAIIYFDLIYFNFHIEKNHTVHLSCQLKNHSSSLYF